KSSDCLESIYRKTASGVRILFALLERHCNLLSFALFSVHPYLASVLTWRPMDHKASCCATIIPNTFKKYLLSALNPDLTQE
uniref:Uncharacterized protein n=1 Tax=Romanomermis culicivorax TaxID=13658 RepID=A0A915J4E5_ROMCU